MKRIINSKKSSQTLLKAKHTTYKAGVSRIPQ